MITNMIVLLCLSALFPVLMGTDEVKSDFSCKSQIGSARDCSDIYLSGKNASGVYTITTIDGPVQVYCEMVSGDVNHRGQWMVFLRRMDGEVNFFRPWDSYKWGFGNKEGEYWLGVEYIHQLTSRSRYRLRVDMEDYEGQKAYAVYESFYVESEANGYKLHVSGFVNGGAGDSLSPHNGMKFSTYDKDQDNSGSNCALKYSLGGFWYNDCFSTNPTGQYFSVNVNTITRAGATWYYWKKNYNTLKSITMKIRRNM